MGGTEEADTVAAADNWTSIYEEHAGVVYRMMIGEVRNHADAEELTAEVFSRALIPLRATASRREIRAYLLATGRSVLAAHWKRVLSGPITTLPEELAAPSPSVTYSPGLERRAAAILAALPERYRLILELRFLRGYTLREAAAEMSISIGNAKVLQHRALAYAAGLDATGAGAASGR